MVIQAGIIYGLGFASTLFFLLLMESMDPNGSVKKEDFGGFMAALIIFTFFSLVWPIFLAIAIIAGIGYVMLRILRMVFWRK